MGCTDADSIHAYRSFYWPPPSRQDESTNIRTIFMCAAHPERSQPDRQAIHLKQDQLVRVGVAQ